jgi:hypothetical protein
MEALEISATGAWTETGYTETFINCMGQNLKKLLGRWSVDFAGSDVASIDRGTSSG